MKKDLLLKQFLGKKNKCETIMTVHKPQTPKKPTRIKISLEQRLRINRQKKAIERVKNDPNGVRTYAEVRLGKAQAKRLSEAELKGIEQYRRSESASNLLYLRDTSKRVNKILNGSNPNIAQKPIILDPTTKKNIRLYVIKNKATVQQQAIRLIGPTAAGMTEKELITFHTLQIGNDRRTSDFFTYTSKKQSK